MKEISAEDVEKQLNSNEKLHVIDVREDEEVAKGMIPGAKHIPLGDLPDHVDEFDPSEEYIMVCRSGGRSGKAQQILIDKGIEAVNMTGGMLDWHGETKAK